jgi:VanZ family protein
VLPPLLTILLLVCITVLSLTPDSEAPGGSAFVWAVHVTPTLLQKSAHVAIYGLLALAFATLLRAMRPMAARLLLAFTLAVGYGIAMEWLQTFVPGRFGGLTDVLLNALGALAGLTLGPPVLRRLRITPRERGESSG